MDCWVLTRGLSVRFIAPLRKECGIRAPAMGGYCDAPKNLEGTVFAGFHSLDFAPKLRKAVYMGVWVRSIWEYGMKTTIEIQDSLLTEARAFAEARATTLRRLVEDGLRLVLRQQASELPFQLSDCSVDGDGLELRYSGASLAELRDAIYGEST